MSRVVKVPEIHPDDEYYKIDSNSPGIALIFNHFNFKNKKICTRSGTENDYKIIHNTFKGLRFKTRIYHNYTKKQIEEILRSVSKQDHSKNDCLAVVVMSHADTNVIHAYDEKYNVNTLWKHFTEDNSTLAGKPKLFFIQGCCYSNTDDAQIDGLSKPHNVIEKPTITDVLVMYSTPSGKCSFECSVSGCSFIQVLCNELARKSKTHDLFRILTGVNRMMAFSYPDNHKNMKQIVSTLTRILIFNF